jgi:hypothetical protein
VGAGSGGDVRGVEAETGRAAKMAQVGSAASRFGLEVLGLGADGVDVGPHVGAHEWVGRERWRWAPERSRFRGMEKRHGRVVEVEGAEGLGVGGDVRSKGGGKITVDMAAGASVAIFVSFVPSGMSAFGAGERYDGTLLVKLEQLDLEVRGKEGSVAAGVVGLMDPPVRSQASLAWVGYGSYAAAHTRAAIRLQSRQRGIMARAEVLAVRRALDRKWLSRYGVAPVELKVVQCGDTFVDLTWEMPMGVGLCALTSKGGAGASGQKRRGKKVSVWGSGVGGRMRNAGGAGKRGLGVDGKVELLNWDEVEMVPVAGEFQVRINGEVLVQTFPWAEVFGQDAHNGDGILRGRCRVMGLESDKQFSVSVRLQGVAWKRPEAVWGAVGAGGGSWRSAALQMIKDDSTWEPREACKYVCTGMCVHLQAL